MTALHFKAKLNTKKVREIRVLYEQGWTIVKIAKHFKVSTSTIGEIIRGRTWKHVQ